MVLWPLSHTRAGRWEAHETFIETKAGRLCGVISFVLLNSSRGLWGGSLRALQSEGERGLTKSLESQEVAECEPFEF